MNYFAHGRHLIDYPFLLAGVSVPDWLSVLELDRRVRVRSKSARRFLGARDGRIVQVAAGICRHHADDDWFHRTRAFSELSWHFTKAIRNQLPKDDGFRPSFLGHILVELLLDAHLIERNPRQLDAYYAAVDAMDVELIAWIVDRMASGSAQGLAVLIPRFSAERFLYDYADDAKLLFRLNNVMHRVRLPSLPQSLCDWLPEARRQVNRRVDELLYEPSS